MLVFLLFLRFFISTHFVLGQEAEGVDGSWDPEQRDEQQTPLPVEPHLVENLKTTVLNPNVKAMDTPKSRPRSRLFLHLPKRAAMACASAPIRALAEFTTIKSTRCKINRHAKTQTRTCPVWPGPNPAELARVEESRTG